MERSPRWNVTVDLIAQRFKKKQIEKQRLSQNMGVTSYLNRYQRNGFHQRLMLEKTCYLTKSKAKQSKAKNGRLRRRRPAPHQKQRGNSKWAHNLIQ